MSSQTNLKVDIAHSGFVSPAEAVQGDGGLRSISVELTDSGKPWYPPAGTEIAVAYTHSNGTKGLYNKLPDGRKAVTVRGNIVTAVLAPQMLAAAGEVKAAIVFSNEKLDQLTTFPITITVRKNLFADAEETVDNIRLQWLEDKLDEYLRKAADSGAFDGADGQSAYQIAVANGFVGTQELWLASLVGPQGEVGPQGPQGASAVVDDTLSISGAAADAKATGDSLSRINDDLSAKADTSDLAKTVKKLDTLYKLTQGQAWDWEEQTNNAYTVDTKSESGALMGDAIINEIAGNTIVEGEALKSAKVDRITVTGRNLFDISKIKKSSNIIIDGNSVYSSKTGYAFDFFDGLFGSGHVNDDISVYPEIEPGEYTVYVGGTQGSTMSFYLLIDGAMKNVGRLNGSTYMKVTVENPCRYTIRRTSGNSVSGFSDFMLTKGDKEYPYAPYHESVGYYIPSAVQALDGYGQSYGDSINVVDFENKVYHKLGSYVDGVWIEDVQDIDISELLATDNLIPIEDGGALTFHHPEADSGYPIPVQTKITYCVKLEVTSQ